MADDQIVKEDAISEEGEALQEAGKPEETSTEQPLTLDAVKQLLADGITEATAKAMESGKELGRREMQGKKDQEVAAAQKQARNSEEILARIKARYAQSDPDAYQGILNDEMSGKLRHYEQQETERQSQERAGVTIKNFEDTMADLISGIGLDPNDKRIEWGDRNSMNLTQRQKAIADSAKKAFQEDSVAREEKHNKELKEMESRITQKLRKESGVDIHDTGSGGGNSSDADFLKGFGSGELPASKANIERYNKIRDNY